MVDENERGQDYVVKVKNFFLNFERKLFHLDSRFIYSSITYTTRFVYASETGLCGTMLRAIEETHNAIVSCPEQHRTG